MRFAFPVMLVSLALPAAADAPRVAADILPVHGLVARVMEGVGEPDLILPPGASPHGYSMRPSEAAVLEQSDLVFWVGEGLTPWLERPLDVVASNATKIELLEYPGTILIEFSDDHGHGHGEHDDEHGHEDHAEDAHEHDEHSHEEHAAKDDDEHAHEEHASDDHHGHDHGPVDPHAWLDPENAKVWLTAIEEALVAADPENASVYTANASKARSELDALIGEISTVLQAEGTIPYAVYHDAYGYFEDRFEIAPTAKLLDGEAAQPSPRRIAETREIVVSQGVRNVFVEPNTNVSLVETIFDGLPVTVCEIDPMGGSIPAGPKHYWQSMRELADTIGNCGAP